MTYSSAIRKSGREFFRVLKSEEFYKNLSSRNPEDFAPFFFLVFPWATFEDELSPMAYCLYRGQFDFLRRRRLEGTMILFRPEFLCPLRGETSLALHSGLFCVEDVKTVPIPLSQKEELEFIIARIQREYEEQAVLNSEALYAMLKVLLIGLIRMAELDDMTPEPVSADIRLAAQFIELVDCHYLTAKKVAFYAEKLRVGANYLNIKVKKVTGQTASHHIQQRIVLEAKRKALWDYMSLKEVAYCLGFTDISYFSRFFKKFAGVSYTDFKRVPAII